MWPLAATVFSKPHKKGRNLFEMPTKNDVIFGSCEKDIIFGGQIYALLILSELYNHRNVPIHPYTSLYMMKCSIGWNYFSKISTNFAWSTKIYKMPKLQTQPICFISNWSKIKLVSNPLNIFVGILGNKMTSKFPFEITWPLVFLRVFYFLRETSLIAYLFSKFNKSFLPLLISSCL